MNDRYIIVCIAYTFAMVTNNVVTSRLGGWGYALSQRFWPYFGGSRHSLVSYREPPGGVRPVDLLLIRPEYYVLQRALSKQSLIVKVTFYGIHRKQILVRLLMEVITHRTVCINRKTPVFQQQPSTLQTNNNIGTLRYSYDGV